MLSGLLPFLLLVGEFPDDKDDEMDGDEEIRRGEPGTEGSPVARESNGQSLAGGRNGHSGSGADGEDAEE